jgi:hypothetical protein
MPLAGIKCAPHAVDVARMGEDLRTSAESSQAAGGRSGQPSAAQSSARGVKPQSVRG